MYDNLPLAIDARWEPLLVLAVGTTLIVGLGTLAGRFVRSAVWQRTLWQVAALGLLVLAGMEITGLGSALVRLSGEKLARAVGRPPEHDIEFQPAVVPSPNRSVVDKDRPGEVRGATVAVGTFAGVASNATARGEALQVEMAQPNARFEFGGPAASFDAVAAGDDARRWDPVGVEDVAAAGEFDRRVARPWSVDTLGLRKRLATP